MVQVMYFHSVVVYMVLVEAHAAYSLAGLVDRLASSGCLVVVQEDAGNAGLPNPRTGVDWSLAMTWFLRWVFKRMVTNRIMERERAT